MPSSRLTILCADVADALGSIPAGTVDLIVSSPPYNIGKEYESATSLDQYLEWQERIANQLVEKLSSTGSVCWQVGNYIDKGEVVPLDIHFYAIFKKCGLKLRNRIIWHFGHGLHASRRFSGRYETILWFTRETYKFNLDAVRIPSKYPGKRQYKGPSYGKPSGNPLGKNPSDFWEFLSAEWNDGVFKIPNVKANHPEKVEHPCQFPVELVERCVLACTDEDDLVLDPYAGVGSALIAAHKWNRRAVGIDRDADYCDIAAERLRRYSIGDLKLRPIGQPVFEPTGRESVSRRPSEWDAKEGTE